jgi:hypothetical protein
MTKTRPEAAVVVPALVVPALVALLIGSAVQLLLLAAKLRAVR